MSDTEQSSNMASLTETEVKMDIKPKLKKVKKELTPERKEQLKQQLKKGRETALKNRQKSALVKKIDAKEKNEASDRKIARNILNIKEPEPEQAKQVDEVLPVKVEPVKVAVEPVKVAVEPVKVAVEPVKVEANPEVEELRAELKRLRDSMYNDFKAKEQSSNIASRKEQSSNIASRKEQSSNIASHKEAEKAAPITPSVKVYNAKQKGNKYNKGGFL